MLAMVSGCCPTWFVPVAVGLFLIYIIRRVLRPRYTLERTSVVIATGCAGGIGGAFVDRILKGKNPPILLLTDVDEKALKKAAEQRGWADKVGDRLVLQQLDVTKPEAWERVVRYARERWGKVDVLLNIAGIIHEGSIFEVTPQHMERVLSINTLGPMYGMREVVASNAMPKGGHIVNVCSLAGIAPTPGISTYTASKFGLRAASLCASVELGGKGIHVSNVCPDAVDTPMLAQQIVKPAAAMTFSGPRVLTAAEVAKVLVDDVLVFRPMEKIVAPFSRGELAFIACVCPVVVKLIFPLLQKKGDKTRLAMARAAQESDGVLVGFENKKK